MHMSLALMGLAITFNFEISQWRLLSWFVTDIQVTFSRLEYIITHKKIIQIMQSQQLTKIWTTVH